MKKLIALCFLLSTQVFAGDYIDLPVSTFESKAEGIYDRINDIINNPEPVLVRYKPVGMKIKDKVINKNQIQFWATKEVLGISKTVLYKGTLDISYVDSQPAQKCFKAFLDFNGSGDLIIENIENLEMIFCTKEKGPDHLIATVKSKMKKGQGYGGVIGPIAKNLIADQVAPIITSIKEEIEKDN
nr:hypothetical protein BHI3_33670 [Bacteriovorax sp. HI3]